MVLCGFWPISLLYTEYGRNAAVSLGAVKHQPVTSRNKMYQQVNVSSPVALLKLRKRNFIPVNLIGGSNSLVKAPSP